MGSFPREERAGEPNLPWLHACLCHMLSIACSVFHPCPLWYVFFLRGKSRACDWGICYLWVMVPNVQQCRKVGLTIAYAKQLAMHQFQTVVQLHGG